MPYVDVENGRRWVGDSGPTGDEIRAELSRNGSDLNANTWGYSGSDTATVEEGPNGARIVTHPRSGGGGSGTPAAPAAAQPGVSVYGGAGAGGGGSADANDASASATATAPSMDMLMQADPEPPIGFEGSGIGSLRQGIGIRQPPSMAALLTNGRPY